MKNTKEEKKEEIIKEIQRIANELNRDTLTEKLFNKHSNSMAISTVKYYFGSWSEAIRRAGLKPIDPYKPPHRHKYSDDELISEIIRISKILSQETLSVKEFDHYSAIDSSTITKRFGSWNIAIKRANLKPTKISEYTDEQVIDEIKRVATILNIDSLSMKEFDYYSKMGSATIPKHFGTWNKAIKLSGLKPIIEYNISDERLLKDIIKLYREEGKLPTQNTISSKGEFSPTTYRMRFGGIIKAIAIAKEKYPEEFAIIENNVQLQSIGQEEDSELPSKGKASKKDIDQKSNILYELDRQTKEEFDENKTKMKDELIKQISRLKKKDNIYAYNEAETRSYIVEKFFWDLGWNEDEIIHEYKIGNDSVDYAIKFKNIKAIIEVKKVKEKLEKDSHQKQLINYAFQEGVEMAILTNGIKWSFFLPMYKVKWKDREFCALDLMEQNIDSVTKCLINLLSRSEVISDKYLEYAENMLKEKEKRKKTEKILEKIWINLLKQPDPKVTNFFIDFLIDKIEKEFSYKPDRTIVNEFVMQNLSSLDR